jgi:hypothetical protein
VKPLIAGVNFSALLADKAFDTNAIRAELDERDALAVIPLKANRKLVIPHDADMYEWRHLIENCADRHKDWQTQRLMVPITGKP